MPGARPFLRGPILLFSHTFLPKSTCVRGPLLCSSGPVSLKERLVYTVNKLFVKQVKSFQLLLDLDPFILQCSLHNIEYIKFTSPQDISIKVIQIHNYLLTS